MGIGGISRSAERFAAEAAQRKAVSFEEDYVDARFVYQALPLAAKERRALRAKLVQYLVGPVARLEVERTRKEAGLLGNNDDYDRVLDAFREALELYAPAELWAQQGPSLDPQERALLVAAARAVVGLFSPRGHEQAVATGLFVLQTLEPGEKAWPERLSQLFSWLETGAELSVGGGRGGMSTPEDVLDGLAGVWPTPAVVERLAARAARGQDGAAGVLRRSLGLGAGRGTLGEALMDGDAMQARAVNLAALYLRCGQLARAAQAIERFAGQPGDDPGLRRLLAAAARPGARPDAALALARRFLPRLDLLGGTSTDRLDPAAAAEVIRAGLERHPKDTGLLVLGSRVARFLQSPFLAIRYLEEAQAVLERSRGGANVLGEVAAELLDLSFSRLRLLIDDPQQIEPAAREAEALRRRFAEGRRRFGDTRFRTRDADIDFALARGFVDAGLIERAEPLLLRAQHEADASAEVTLHIAKLVLKRGETDRAVVILRKALDSSPRGEPAAETIGSVEGRSRLARALGDAYEAKGSLDEARAAWKVAARGGERLMVAQLQRKNFEDSAEATFEVGRLYYLLGKRAEGIQKLGEAVEQNEGRSQTYIDALAFLVQQGESEAALEIYRRALARPSRSVTEYFKVYSSLWILDLTRRSSSVPDATALAYLRSLDTRKLHLRPRRDAAWYVPLARYMVGRLTYEQILALADTPGKRAELYFYEGMRRLSEGRSDDAHTFWNKVLETRMFSFFEFDMAARYLRTGAPSRPRPQTAADAETI